MSKSILNRIQRAKAFYRILLARTLPYWRDESNPQERRATRLALTPRAGATRTLPASIQSPIACAIPL